jgi:hypothetical protein
LTWGRPEHEKAPSGGVISFLMEKCRGKAHDTGVVEITANSGHQYD